MHTPVSFCSHRQCGCRFTRMSWPRSTALVRTSVRSMVNFIGLVRFGCGRGAVFYWGDATTPPPHHLATVVSGCVPRSGAWGLNVENARSAPLVVAGRSLFMVGIAGFEPTTPRSQSECATKLRHIPSRTLCAAYFTCPSPIFQKAGIDACQGCSSGASAEASSEWRRR